MLRWSVCETLRSGKLAGLHHCTIVTPFFRVSAYLTSTDSFVKIKAFRKRSVATHLKPFIPTFENIWMKKQSLNFDLSLVLIAFYLLSLYNVLTFHQIWQEVCICCISPMCAGWLYNKLYMTNSDKHWESIFIHSWVELTATVKLQSVI